jgi:hypothetical protein
MNIPTTLSFVFDTAIVIFSFGFGISTCKASAKSERKKNQTQ